MRKILIDKALYSSINKFETVLQRADVKVFTADTTDELLSLHRQEKMSLIISRLDTPGTPPEQIYGQIRNDPELRGVSLILVCRDQPSEKVRAEHCGANAVVTQQPGNGNVVEKANSFLDIPTRSSYRVLLSVTIDAQKDKAFFCRSENISTTGMLLETERELSPGDRLTCSFFLPGAKQIEVSGEVVRVINGKKGATRHYGMRFSKISAVDAAAISTFIKKKSARA